MLRLWRDQLSLAIAPDRVILVRSSGGLRPKLIAKVIVPVAATETGWAPALEMLAKTLRSDAQWQNAAVSAVVANSFVRYQLVPWSDEISGPEERAAYVRQSFTQIYGEAVAEWDYVVSEAARGASWFVCAIDRDLMAQLETAVAQTGSKLISVAPHLMPAFNNARRTIKNKDCWFVQVEKDRLLLGLILGGRWQMLSSRQIAGEHWQRELPLLLDREWRLNGMREVSRVVVISAPEANQGVLDGAGKWVFHWLRPNLRYGLAVRAHAPYAMAVGA